MSHVTDHCAKVASHLPGVDAQAVRLAVAKSAPALAVAYRPAIQAARVAELRAAAEHLRRYEPSIVKTDAGGERYINLVTTPEWLDERADRIAAEAGL